MNKTVSDTILTQLGGSRFLTMTGAKNLATSGTDLSFHLPKALKKGINLVKVTLEANDTYTVKFYKFSQRKFLLNVVHEEEMVYTENLRSLFEEQTGYLTGL